MNTLLMVDFIRKLAVKISMSLPQVRENILPSLFGAEPEEKNAWNR